MAKASTFNLSRSGGIGGYKRGHSPASAKVAYAARHNQIVAANLKLGMEAVPKYLLGAYAATVLDQAIRHTVHDSSRFAANWNLSVGDSSPLNNGNPDPYHYNESGESYGTIGTKGEKGRFRLAVTMAKRMYYGYKKDSSGHMTLTKGRLAEALFPRAAAAVQRTAKTSSSLSGISLGWRDKAGTPPKIFLYNAFMRPNMLRRSGWTPEQRATGRSYPQNALPKSGGALLPEDVSSVMGQGLVQDILHSLTAKMRAANVQGTIMDPFL